MPIYEYRCSACGHEVEVLQKMSDQPLADCPSCGKATLSKLVSAAGFQLKGSGWYVTDFRDGKKPTGDSKSKEGGSPSASSSSKETGDGASAGGSDSKSTEAKSVGADKPAQTSGSGSRNSDA